MRRALAVAAGNPAAPFGAVIVDARADRELAAGLNAAKNDPTAHGEIVALRALAAAGPRPAGAALVLYTTAEPCPMCAAACFWAGIDRIVYGVSIPWLAEHGWRQIPLRAAALLRDAPASTAVAAGPLADDCAALFHAARSSR